MKKSNFKNGFSIAEVLIFLLVVSVILIALTPIITKKAPKNQLDGAVFTYKEDNSIKETSDNVCYLTGINYSDYTESYTASKACSEYTFTVPNGINYLNFTLVAGGGGGGGAAGGKLTDSTITATTGKILEQIKKIKINLLTAKGQSGGNGSSDSTYCYGGKGGASSPAIVNFDIPNGILRGKNFSAPLGTPTSTNIVITNSSTEASLAISDTKYAINLSGSTYTPSCSLTGTFSISGCLLGEENYIASVAGNPSTKIKKSLISSGSAVVPSARGGNTQNGSIYGAGGNGQTMTVTSSSCSGRISATAGQNGYVSAKITTENAGGTGGGGAAGTVTRVLGLEVNPGDILYIVVGKGGDGGRAGISSSSATAGSNGTGGTSSAVYLNGTLVAMVNGGAGGKGGAVVTGSNFKGSMGASGRNQAKVFYPSTAPNIGTQLASTYTTNCTTTKPYSSLNVMCLQYHKLNNAPYSALNTLSGFSGDTITAFSNNNNRYGGISPYNSSLRYVTAYVSGTSYENIYDGFYYRSLIKSSGTSTIAVYPGGLGGFSGLGGKTGCGAYFMGNFDGRYNNGSNTNDSIKNKFLLGNAVPYEVSHYYDNCSETTPNGATAEFIYPNPKALTFGQAGTGGGGGGFSTNDGAGNGGNGQNGYVMIDWLK